MSDRELAARLQAALVAQDDRKAFECLWRLYYERVCAALRSRRVPQPAIEDVAQDTFRTIFEELSACPTDRIEPWVFSIAKYAALSWHTRSGRFRVLCEQLVATQWFPTLLETGDGQATRELDRRLLEARERVGGSTNQCIFDCLDAGMTDSEIVAFIERRTGVPLSEGALRKRRVRVREAVDAHLKAAGWRR